MVDDPVSFGWASLPASDTFQSVVEKYYGSKTLKKGIPMKAVPLTQGVLLGYSRYTKGGKAIASGLDCRFIESSNLNHCVMMEYVVQSWDTFDAKNAKKIPFLINWGNGNKSKKVPQIDKYITPLIERLINDPSKVSLAGNKRLFFETMKSAASGPRIPEFTTDLEVAQQWTKDGIVVLGRQEHGSSGQDIAFYGETPDKFLSAELWVQYKKKKQEFRLHFMNGSFFIIQQKVLPKADPDGNAIPKESVDFRIRTHRTGFIFQKNDIVVPQDVFNQAEKAVVALGLDFGAIDVIYNKAEDKAYVLEINTAPGLEETTILDYETQFRRLLNLKEKATLKAV